MPQYQPYGNSYGSMTVPQPVFIPATRQQTQSLQSMYNTNPTMQYFPMVNQPAGLRGRVVSTPDEITPQEVPMDGGYSFFPLADNSAVYMKAWTPDGKINTFKFIPESIELPVDQTPDNTSMILQRLDSIESMLKQKTGRRNNNQKANVEEESNE